MRILDRYVGREILSHTLLGLSIFTFVFYVPQLVRLMELLVQHSGNSREVAQLFLGSIPPVLIFTLPMSILVGVLIGLGRLSADSEIVALNASGISLRRLLVPIGALALAATAITFAITLWLGPLSLRTLQGLEDRLRASQASFAIEPRVFDERIPHYVLYVQDVGASGTHWRSILLAVTNSAAGSKLTLAKDAIVIAEPAESKLEIHFDDVSTHEYNLRDPEHYELSTSASESSDLPLESDETSRKGPAHLTDPERSLAQLLAVRGQGANDARVEFQRRLAFPSACLLFAMLGIPLGVRPRRGGRAAGFILAIPVICAYYLLFVTGVHMAQQGSLSPALGVWGANVATALAGILLLRRLERVRREPRWIQWLSGQLFRHETGGAISPETPLRAVALPDDAALSEHAFATPAAGRSSGFPLLIDLYVLRTFAYWFVLMLAACVFLFDAFTLFDLLEDISRHHISFLVVANYFLHLSPLMVYQIVPLAALVATLVTLGLLAKNNEVTAFKACGISLYRLSLPLLVAGFVLAGGMFLLDQTYLPYANQKQDALRAQIIGRPAQTYFQPAHEWIFGDNNKVYNYRFFDPDRNLFGDLNVFELDPTNFQMRRRIFASRAHWEPSLHTWVLEGGWVRDFSGSTVTRYQHFQASTFDELTEPPSYFKREVRQYYQMNWEQLRDYIRSLQQAGFDTSRLSVEWHRKFAFPLIAPIIMFLGIPFAFLVGTRGATGGLALAVGIGIVYWSAAALFEAMGAVGQLPPFLAAWAPDAIFAFLGLYFFLKMPT